MKLYYTAYTDTVVEEWYCDALTFRVKDETLYSMDIAGEHEFHCQKQDGKFALVGRVKGDCNDVCNLTEDTEHVRMTYDELASLLKNATEFEELVLVDAETGEQIESEFLISLYLNGGTVIMYNSKTKEISITTE